MNNITTAVTLSLNVGLLLPMSCDVKDGNKGATTTASAEADSTASTTDSVKRSTPRSWSREEIRATVDSIIIRQSGVDERRITPDARYFTDISFDSLDVVEAIMACEKAFDISIADEDAEAMATVGDTYNYLEQRLLPADTTQ